ncbi:hypothetical protein EW145_g5559 [Phellinidium pouzarii]|uniref:TRIP4/RQT4 C2HC5-type zinc finger domain-containing protein n=1 Tax=Phellinidium pouzarii TaxID=167371 RepID=A0A4S4L1E1_9AGAM|nr:hypothetical protein EW145_g5559 [Phellinidium pouzarii]
MSRRTAWSKSSLPSDRIKPQTRPPNTPKRKAKAGTPPPQAPKSAAVRALEETIASLQNTSSGERDTQGGCFCQGHTTSPRTSPLCAHCGLIMCALNPPHLACPHCSAPLASPPAREALLSRLQQNLVEVQSKEEEDAARAREEARRAEGAFPLLGVGVNSGTSSPQPQQTHKVLSLNAKTKRVTLASYSPPLPPLLSLRNQPLQISSPEQRVHRESPPPPHEIAYARGPSDPARSWLDMRGDGFVRTLTYVRDPDVVREEARVKRKAERKALKALKALEDKKVDANNPGPAEDSASHS